MYYCTLSTSILRFPCMKMFATGWFEHRERSLRLPTLFQTQVDLHAMTAHHRCWKASPLSSSPKCHQILKTFPGRERDSRKEGASSRCTDRRGDRRRPAGVSRPAPSAAPRAAIGRRAAGTRRHSGGGEGGRGEYPRRLGGGNLPSTTLPACLLSILARMMMIWEQVAPKIFP